MAGAFPGRGRHRCLTYRNIFGANISDCDESLSPRPPTMAIDRLHRMDCRLWTSWIGFHTVLNRCYRIQSRHSIIATIVRISTLRDCYDVTDLRIFSQDGGNDGLYVPSLGHGTK